MVSAIVLGSLVVLAGVGQALSPLLKEKFPKVFAPKKGGG